MILPFCVRSAQRDDAFVYVCVDKIGFVCSWPCVIVRVDQDKPIRNANKHRLNYFVAPLFLFFFLVKLYSAVPVASHIL